MNQHKLYNCTRSNVEEQKRFISIMFFPSHLNIHRSVNRQRRPPAASSRARFPKEPLPGERPILQGVEARPIPSQGPGGRGRPGPSYSRWPHMV